VSKRASTANTPEALLGEAPFRALLRLAGPTTAVMSIAALSNVLYTYFVSRLGAEAIAAVSLVFPVSLILTTLMGGGIGSGVSSAVARCLGAGKPKEATAVAEHAFALTALLGGVLSVVLVAAAPSIFRLMGATGDVLAAAVAFSRVLFSGLVLTFFVATCDSVLRGEGNVRVPALWSSLSLVSQIVLTPLFMFGLGLGIRGAPAATLVGQLIGAGPRVRHIFTGKAVLRPRLVPRGLRAAPLVEILRVGVPVSLGTLVTYLGMMVLTTIMARFGTADLAAYGLGSRLDFVLLTVCYGTGVAVLTLVGFAAGAGRVDLAAGYAWRAVVLMFGAVSAPALALWLAPQLWFGLFTADPAIRSVGQTYFRIIGLSYPLMATSMMLAFAFQGIGRATVPLVIMVVRITAVVVGALVLSKSFGYGAGAVFALIAAGNFLSATLLSLAFVGSVRRLGRPAAARLASSGAAH
jgi:putative MATE family efflux protein